MIDVRCVEGLSGADLLARTRELVRRSRDVEADLLVYLGEIDERKLYRDRAYSSMFGFCVGELGFSEDVTYSRITVARAARHLPGIIDVIRAGQVHLTGVRLLVPHLTPENHREILSRAAGKPKGEIEELVVSLAPRPIVPDEIRKLPAQPGLALQPAGADTTTPSNEPTLSAQPAANQSIAPTSGDRQLRSAPARQSAAVSVMAPLAPDAFKIQFTGSRALRDKLREAQALLRHRVPNGDLASVVELALDALIGQVKKERFGVGSKPRKCKTPTPDEATTRHIPDDIRRAVFARDGGRCTFTDETGRRCNEKNGIEFDHIDGFALARSHSMDRIRLLCRAHNQHAAEKLYGRKFMERARAASTSTRSGTSSEALNL
jgi:5-methylcytosine-specific restriction endonuclease McrA